jgi:TPP-dependent pyruvate/acetoin dehydrogenase alpha subunit
MKSRSGKKQDPIVTFTRYLQEQGLANLEDLEELEREVAAEMEAAIAFAEAGTWEPVEDLTRFVYSPRAGDDTISSVREGRAP